MSEPPRTPAPPHTPSNRHPPPSLAARSAFGAWLTSVKLTAGDPSCRALERRTAQLGERVPRSTLFDGLTGRRLIGLAQALLVIRACGGGPALETECRNRWAAARRGQVVRTPADTGTRHTGRLALLADHELLSLVHWNLSLIGSTALLRLSGEWDVHAMSHLKPRMTTYLERKPAGGLVVDLGEVTFADSTLVGGLMYCLRKLRAYGTRVHLVLGPRPEQADTVSRVLLLTGATAVLPAYATLDEALAALPPPTAPNTNNTATRPPAAARAGIPLPAQPTPHGDLN